MIVRKKEWEELNSKINLLEARVGGLEFLTFSSIIEPDIEPKQKKETNKREPKKRGRKPKNQEKKVK